MISLLYPGNIKRKYTKVATYDNRGMGLEYVLEMANQYYRDKGIAYIYKKPTPIHVVKVDYKKSKKITEAYYEAPSTLDFNGVYKGRYIEFDAKETKRKSSFPISNVHEHQIKHIRNVLSQKGIVFLIIKLAEKYYLLPGDVFLNFVDNKERKSIPANFLENNAYPLFLKLRGLDYIDVVDKLIGG